MTERLPFTLTPLDGEGFVAWLHAYATRLDVTPVELTDALGLPDYAAEPEGWRPQLDADHVEPICTATGLSEAAVRALLRPAISVAEERRGPVAASERHELSAIERLRHATTIAHDARLRHATTLCRGRVTAADPAIERASRLPDQLWPAWAIRLADDDAFDPTTFRSSALVALLVPHSALPLRELIELVDPRINPGTVACHVRKLVSDRGDASALQILTELAFAIDTHGLPIDYARRRRLVAASELIDEDTWVSLTRRAGARTGSQRRTRYARCYLYELLTGCNLDHAPSPYRLESSIGRSKYPDFVAGLPQALVEALHQHAEGLLLAAGITGEPLQWQPPIDWVTTSDWPGSDPDQTDPDRIQRALPTRGTPHRHAAASLGISTEHLRYVIRQHPRPHPASPHRRRALARAPSADAPADALGDPKTISVDPDWLRREYLTWRRPLPDIAAELGCHVGALRRFALEHGIPLRPSSGPTGFAHLDAPGLHPSQVPEPLRSALTGRHSRQRLHRFVCLSQHPSLNQAGRALDVGTTRLTRQLQQLERDCGGLLVHRRARLQPMGPLTPLGEQLRRQAVEHLQLASA